LNAALEAADPEAREALERAAVADVESQPDAEAFNLISAAVRRELSLRVKNVDPEQIRLDRGARLLLEQMENPATSHNAAEQLLGWLEIRMGDHA
jgi:DNA primase